MAVSNSGVLWPATRRVTILLAPSDLVKRGTHFDLAIALAVLAACGDVTQRSLSDTLVIGELTLDRRAALGARRAADGDGGVAPRLRAGDRARAPGPRGGDGARA